MKELSKALRKVASTSRSLCSDVPASYEYLKEYISRTRKKMEERGDYVGIVPFSEFEKNANEICSLQVTLASSSSFVIFLLIIFIFFQGEELKLALYFLNDHGDVVYINHPKLQNIVVIRFDLFIFVHV